jgi:hypothetical protein
LVERDLTETLTTDGWWTGKAENIKKQCVAKATIHESVLVRGLYYYQLQGWFNAFGAERIKVLASDAFFKEPVKVTEEVIDFVSKHQTAEFVAKSNQRAKVALQSKVKNETLRNSKTPKSFAISEALHQEILTLYQPYNELLYALLAQHNILFERFHTPGLV